jgi:hypothetical protein
MSKFDDLLEETERAEDIAYEKREKVVSLILVALSPFDLNTDKIDHVQCFGRDSKAWVQIDYSWRAAGCDRSDNIILPKYIFDADDPAQEARKYINEEKIKTEAKDKAIKLKEYKRLQEELGL